MAQPNRNPPRGKRGKPLRDYLRAARPTDAEIQAILRRASREAERLILREVERHGGRQNVRAAQLMMIQRQLRAQQDRMWSELGEAIRDGMSEVMTTAYVEAEDLLTGYLARNRYDMTAVRMALIAQARRGLEAVLAKAANDIPLSSQVYRTGVLASGLVTRALQTGMLLQKSAKAIARDVRNMIDPKVPGGVSYAAFRLARTELNNAFKTAQEQRYADEPWVTGMRWNLSGSHPTPDECNEYAEEDRHELGAGIWPVGQRPHSHPNCLCYLTPEQVEEEVFINAFINGDYDDAIGATLGSPTAEVIRLDRQSRRRRR